MKIKRYLFGVPLVSPDQAIRSSSDRLEREKNQRKKAGDDLTFEKNQTDSYSEDDFKGH